MQIPQWLKQVGRDVLIALLISILTVLGYSGAIVQPAINQARAAAVDQVFQTMSGQPQPGQVSVLTRPTKDTHISELHVTGAADVDGTATANAALVAGMDLRLTAQTAISVTDGGIITATGAYVPLTSAGNVTVTIATSTATAGDLLLIKNGSNTTILIQDASTLMADADLSLTQYDTSLFIFDGTNWLQVGHSHN